MKNSGSIVIEASPQRVFYFLDDPQQVLRWIPNLVENENLQVTESKVGSTFRQVYLEHGQRMEMRGVVTHYEPNRRLACEISGDAFNLTVDYRLEDLAGRTRLTQDSEVRFKGLFMKVVGGLMGPLVKKSSKKQLEGSFAKLKQLAEASDGDCRS